MRYNSFEAEDFALDPTFIKWVRQPNARLDAFWKEWLGQYPEKAGALREARRLVCFLQFRTELPQAEEHAEVKQRIRARIAAPVPLQIQKHPRPYPWLRVAAAVGLILGMVALWYFYLASPYTYYNTGYSEQREILLPDSTLVTLNANSELRTKSDWSEASSREVWLEGEAYFAVVKKPQAADGRFIVHTGQLDVEVLGTAFNVQVRRGKTEIVLNEGKVALRQLKQQKSLVMEPGDKAILDDDRLISRIKVNPERYASWKDNRLFFDNASLREIFLRIRDIHGYQVRVSDPALLERQFTGSCPINEPDILFAALSETFNLRMTREDKQVILRPKRSTKSE